MITAQDVYDAEAKAINDFLLAEDETWKTGHVDDEAMAITRQYMYVMRSWEVVAEEVRNGEDPTIAVLRREL